MWRNEGAQISVYRLTKNVETPKTACFTGKLNKNNYIWAYVYTHTRVSMCVFYLE